MFLRNVSSLSALSKDLPLHQVWHSSICKNHDQNGFKRLHSLEVFNKYLLIDLISISRENVTVIIL